MSILAYGDLHFVNKTKFYSHIEAASSVCRFIANQIKKLNPTFVVNLGDTFHHDWLDVPTIWYAYRGIQEISEACAFIQAYHLILVGNHETYSQYTEQDPLIMFENLPYTTVIRKAQVIQDMVFVPYIKEIDRLRKILLKATHNKDWENHNPVSLFTHNDIIGAKRNPASLEDKGILPSELKQFSFVVNGHYHHPHQIDNIHFAGSPLYHDFSDEPVPLPRGLVFIENGKVTRIEHSHTPVYLKLKVSTPDEFNFLNALPNKERSIVKVETTQEFSQAVMALKPSFQGLVVLTKQNYSQVKKDDTISIFTEPKDAITHYAESVVSTSLSKPKLKDIGISILQEVS